MTVLAYQAERPNRRGLPAGSGYLAAGAHWLVEVRDMTYGWDTTGMGGWGLDVAECEEGGLPRPLRRGQALAVG